jgi:hypothetical protein
MSARIVPCWGRGQDCLEVAPSEENYTCKHSPLVVIRQNAGSMSFIHMMSTEQARDMAKALIDCADESEQLARLAAA